MRSDKENSETIRRALEDAFPPKSVMAVHTRRDVDHDGDPVLWVRVVLAEGVLPLQSQPGLSVKAEIWSSLRELDEPAFPVLVFMTEQEERKFGVLAA